MHTINTPVRGIWNLCVLYLEREDWCCLLTQRLICCYSTTKNTRSLKNFFTSTFILRLWEILWSRAGRDLNKYGTDNAYNSGLPKGSSSYSRRAVVTALTLPLVLQSVPARETCWGLLNCMAWKNWRQGKYHTALFFLVPGHLFVVTTGHSTVGKTDLGLISYSYF